MSQNQLFRSRFPILGQAPSVPLPSNIALSAWQLAGNSVFQRDIAVYYSNNQSLAEQIGNYTVMLLTFGGEIVSANLLVTVKFSDGSIANFKITGIDYKGELIFKFFNAIDNLGNRIPTTAGQLSGQYKMNTSLLESYRNTVNRFYFGLIAPPIPSGTVVILDCHVNTASKEVVCKNLSGDSKP